MPITRSLDRAQRARHRTPRPPRPPPSEPQTNPLPPDTLRIIAAVLGPRQVRRLRAASRAAAAAIHPWAGASDGALAQHVARELAGRMDQPAEPDQTAEPAEPGDPVERGRGIDRVLAALTDRRRVPPARVQRWLPLARSWAANPGRGPADLVARALDLAFGHDQPIVVSCPIRPISVVITTESADLPSFAAVPPLVHLTFIDCPNLRQLPELPPRFRNLTIQNVGVERIDGPPPRADSIDLVDCPRLEHVTRRFLDRATRSLWVRNNPRLVALPHARQRRSRARAARRLEGAVLEVRSNAHLETLATGFGARWRVESLRVTDNYRLVALPAFMGARAIVGELDVSENQVLTDVGRGFLHAATLDRIKLTHNRLLRGLPPVAFTAARVTIAGSERLRQLPASLATECRIGLLKVRSHVALERVFDGDVVLHGALDVYDCEAVTTVADSIRFAGALGGLRVISNPSMLVVARCMSGRIHGPLEVFDNAQLQHVCRQFEVLNILGCSVCANPMLRGLPRGLLHDQTIVGDLAINDNTFLPALGPYVGVRLRVLGDVSIARNQRLARVDLGDVWVSGNVVVDRQTALQTLRVGAATVQGCLQVTDNPRLSRLVVGRPGGGGGGAGGAGGAAQIAALVVTANAALETALAVDGHARIDELTVLRNPRMRRLSEGGFEGRVGVLDASRNPRLVDLGHDLMACVRGGITVEDNHSLREFPSGWPAADLVLAGSVRVCNNPALLALARDLRLTCARLEVCNNQAMRTLATGDLRVGCSGDVRVRYNGLERLAGGQLELTSHGEVELMYNRDLRAVARGRATIASLMDMTIEGHPRVSWGAATAVCRGSLVVARNGDYPDTADEPGHRPTHGHYVTVELEGRAALYAVD